MPLTLAALHKPITAGEGTMSSGSHVQTAEKPLNLGIGLSLDIINYDKELVSVIIINFNKYG